MEAFDGMSEKPITLDSEASQELLTLLRSINKKLGKETSPNVNSNKTEAEEPVVKKQLFR
jgi:hypothetical protein